MTEVDDTSRAAGERVSDTQRLPRALLPLTLVLTNGTIVLDLARDSVPCDLHLDASVLVNAPLTIEVTASTGRHLVLGVCPDCLAEALAVHLGRLHVLAGGAVGDLGTDDA